MKEDMVGTPGPGRQRGADKGWGGSYRALSRHNRVFGESPRGQDDLNERRRTRTKGYPYLPHLPHSFCSHTHHQRHLEIDPLPVSGWSTLGLRYVI